jgi:cobalamin-dependent methionine synthase I
LYLNTTTIQKSTSKPNIALSSDFNSNQKRKGLQDYMGAFFVLATTGLWVPQKSYKKEFGRSHQDDHSAINDQGIRPTAPPKLCRVFTEKRLHWGYSSQEDLDNADLIKEKQVHARHRLSCVQTTEKETIWKLGWE